MRKNYRTLRLFTVLTLCTAYIFGFSHFGAKAFSSFFAEEERYQPGTFIGDMSLEGKTPQEAIVLLAAASADWKKKSSLRMAYKEKTIDIETNQFEIDPEETITGIVDGRQNAMVVRLNESTVTHWVEMISPTLSGAGLNLEKLKAKLIEPASMLKAGTFTVNLGEFLPEAEQVAIATGTLEVKGDSKEIEKAIKTINTIKLEPHTVFSFNDFIKSQGLEGVSSTTLSMIASAAYEAVLKTNFEIIERNISKELPVYSRLGFEARIDPKLGRDFIFENPNDSAFNFKFEFSRGKVTVTMTGSRFLYEYRILAEDKDIFKPKTIKQYSPFLQQGQVDVTEEGKEGFLIRIYREIYSEGKLLDTEAVSEDFYPPVHRVEVYPLSPVEDGQDANQPDGNATPIPEQAGDEAGAPSGQAGVSPEEAANNEAVPAAVEEEDGSPTGQSGN